MAFESVERIRHAWIRGVMPSIASGASTFQFGFNLTLRCVKAIAVGIPALLWIVISLLAIGDLNRPT